MSEFSNEDKDVFIVKLERMIDRGALLSRYSRTSNLDIRDVYRKEFVGKEDRGKNFYKKVFLEYGDESVSELVTAQVAMQRVSNVLSKTAEELRVGLSFLEKSSRYVRYDKKVDGRYLFAEGKSIGMPDKFNEQYESLCNSLFDLYSAAYPSAIEFYRKKFPIETLSFTDDNGNNIQIKDLKGDDFEDAKKSYESALRARALDDLRYLLPASTLTNVGISGNARSYINLIQKLKSSRLPEYQRVASSLYAELETEFPNLIDSAVNSHGESTINYVSSLNTINVPQIKGSGKNDPLVKLVSFESQDHVARRVAALIAFKMQDKPLSDAVSEFNAMDMRRIESIYSQIASLRKNRRDKLPREFEVARYLFEVNTNYGAFRDMQRHRFLSIVRQYLSCNHGYDTPTFFRNGEFSDRFMELMDKARELNERLRIESGPEIAQYCVPFAYHYPVSVEADLRELIYFCELRSTPQAHEDLRHVGMEICRSVENVHPIFKPLFKFVDFSSYSLGRLTSEQRSIRKLRDVSNR